MRHLLYFRLISRIVLFCFSWSALSFAQAPVSDSTSQSADQKFTANADLVLVPVVVRQGKQYVPGLTKDNFVVLENGASQSVAFVNEIAETEKSEDFVGAGSALRSHDYLHLEAAVGFLDLA